MLAHDETTRTWGNYPTRHEFLGGITEAQIAQADKAGFQWVWDDYLLGCNILDIGGLGIPGLANCDPNPPTKKKVIGELIRGKKSSTHVNDMNVRKCETIRFSFGFASSEMLEMLDKFNYLVESLHWKVWLDAIEKLSYVLFLWKPPRRETGVFLIRTIRSLI